MKSTSPSYFSLWAGIFYIFIPCINNSLGDLLFLSYVLCFIFIPLCLFIRQLENNIFKNILLARVHMLINYPLLDANLLNDGDEWKKGTIYEQGIE